MRTFATTLLEGIPIYSRCESDMLLVNIETAVKVKTRPDFFLWVQGVFQGMIAHEALVCGIPSDPGQGLRFEWLASYPIGQARFSELCSGDSGLLNSLVGAWERGGRAALLIDPGRGADAESTPLAKALDRLDLRNAIAHGLAALDGTPAGFFAFFKLPAPPSTRDARMLELMVPYVHTAWLRCSCDQVAQAGSRSERLHEILTTREVEILNWVERGKSNNEIGQILSISHLTVKNHVQKILRKLNVQNRAQAVARGISLQFTAKWAASNEARARGERPSV